MKPLRSIIWDMGAPSLLCCFLIAMVIIAFYFRQVRELEHLYD